MPCPVWPVSHDASRSPSLCLIAATSQLLFMLPLAAISRRRCCCCHQRHCRYCVAFATERAAPSGRHSRILLDVAAHAAPRRARRPRPARHVRKGHHHRGRARLLAADGCIDRHCERRRRRRRRPQRCQHGAHSPWRRRRQRHSCDASDAQQDGQPAVDHHVAQVCGGVAAVATVIWGERRTVKVSHVIVSSRGRG